ncbi:MAG: DUF167 domain-containing protein [Candidatus Thorarchaeota archaeon]|nr:DUF167 domain-containing protein [Candidatus Thorarchaeota archaeon]
MAEKLLWESERGTFLRVLVRPNSGNRDLIYHLSEAELVVNLKGPAREGKANTELVKRIAKVLGISTGDIKLASGFKSREKTLLISSMSAAQVQQVLSTLQKH